MKYAIGVDIGGTKTAIAIVSSEGDIINKKIITTDLKIEPEKMIERIKIDVEKLIPNSLLIESHIIGIGVGAPGPLDNTQGIIVSPPNLQNWKNVPLKNLLQSSFSFPVKLENDATAAALGEKWLGAGKDSKNFAYMTISTGIGAGFFVDGHLLVGLKGNAGDIGHIVIDPSYGKCTCGQYGCLESIASGTAIARRGSKITGKDLSTEEVFDLYKQGHEKIVSFMDGVFSAIGIACVTIINIFDVEKIIIGGGVSKAGTLLFRPIQDYVQKYALNPAGRKTKILPAQLNQDAGVVGAAALCFNLLE